MSQNLPERSLRDFLSLRHPNHFVLAGANNRNVIITYRFLAAPVRANRDFFQYTDCIFELKVLPLIYARVTRVAPRDFASGRNPCRGNNSTVSTFLNIRAIYQSASSGFRLLGEILAGAKINSLIVPYLTYGICSWGNCASKYREKILLLQKRAFRLICFGKSKEHAVPFFLKSNWLPLPSIELYKRCFLYFMYDRIQWLIFSSQIILPIHFLSYFEKTAHMSVV